MGNTFLDISYVPGLGELNSRLRQAEADSETRFKIERFLEQVPHTMAAAAEALVSFSEVQGDVVSTYLKRPRKPNTVHIYQLEDIDYLKMAFSVERYLEAARRAQNGIWIYLSRVFRQSVPSSLSDIVKNIDSSKLKVDEEIAKIITDYWSSSGERLKDYRDVSQHHAVLSSDGRVTFLPDGRGLVYLVLPNNPEIKSPVKLSYENPKVHAAGYLMDSYRKLLAFVCLLVRELLGHTDETELKRWGHEFKGGVGGRPEGTAPLSLKTIIDDTDAVRAHYEDK